MILIVYKHLVYLNVLTSSPFALVVLMFGYQIEETYIHRKLILNFIDLGISARPTLDSDREPLLKASAT